ncbi:MAG: electron transport complex subunit RsxC [Gammaproteobacteria bacterium]|jgi:electron transport complex protein RnfC|nr:electron transport complex subunit RsxC [Gammaproteobacteria bacterium]
MLRLFASHHGEPTFARGGIHPDEHKELSADHAIEPFVPRSVTVPVSQSLGAPSVPVVKKGDRVVRGQLIASDEAGGVPVHAPVSGIVKSVDRGIHPVLVLDMAITIEAREQEDEPTFQEQPGWETLPREELLERIRVAGVVGLGGATFPTYRKLMLPDDAEVDTLIINGSECEPYLTCDYRLMLEQAEAVVLGAWLIAKIIGVPRCLIGIEDNKADAGAAMTAAIERLALDRSDHPVAMEVVVTQTKYPQGSEKQLIQALTGRLVPQRGLPMQVGIVVQNVATAFACLEAVRNRKPVIERVVTVSGRGIHEPKNLRVPVGTMIQPIIEACGGFDDEVVKVLAGGPMMGRALADLNAPVTKGTSGLLFLTRAETNLDRYQPCIGCGECLDVCPLGLEPNKVSQYVEVGRALETEEFGPLECFECGCCSYSCPSNRPLVQFMQVAKAAYRHEAAKQRTHA